MPYPPQNRPLADDSNQRGGAWTFVDGFIRAFTPDVLEDLSVAVAHQTWDKAGEGLNFALGQTSTPLSTSVVAAEAMGRGASVTEEDVQAYTQKAAAKAPFGATGVMSPMLMGMAAAETTWDYGVNRPIATAALVTDPNSPLWNGNPIQAVDENGEPYTIKPEGDISFPEAVNLAWNRSEDVTAFQAIAANPITYIPMVSGAAPIFNALGGIQQYDPWDDASMAEAQNNPFYVAFTGGGDLALQMALPPAFRAGRLATMRKMGLTNTVRSYEELQVLRTDYQRHTPDKPTAWGNTVSEIASTSDEMKIRQHPAVANNIGADKGVLSRVLAETDDPDTVNEILLANMGDPTALRALAEAAPDRVWTLAEVDAAIISNTRQGVPFRPVGDNLAKVNQVFDSALKRDKYFQSLKEDLTAPDGSIKLNSTWKPTSSVLVEKVRKGGRDLGYAVKTGDWSGAPQWVSQRLTDGKGSWATSRIQWAGSRSPLGHVSNSGARPDEKYIEFDAQMDSLPEFRGNRIIEINNQQMQAFEWRAAWHKRFAEAPDAALPDLWAQMEAEVTDVLARELEIDPEIAARVVDAYRSRIGDEMQYLRDSNGYLFDEANERFIVDPVTSRQMLNSFQTMPLAEIRSQMIQNGSFLRAEAMQLNVGASNVYDFVQKIFRTDVLFRPGYTGKNSIIEPLLSRFIAHGTILTDEGLWATVGNIGKNAARVSKRVAYYAQIHKLMDSSLRTKAKKNEVKALLAERDGLQQVMDAAVAELDSWNGPDAWPRMEEIYGPEVRGALFNAQKRIESIDAALDGTLPEWRQVVEPATLSDIRQKLREYRAIIGDDPEYVETLFMQRDQILRDARARVQSPREAAEADLSALERQLARLEDEQKALSEERIAGWSVAKDGRQRAPRPAEPGETGDLARGRDYRGLAVKRQIESVEEQIAEARRKVESASDEVEVSLTPNEQTTVNNINTVLDRVRESPLSADQFESLRPRLLELQRQRVRYSGMRDYTGEARGGVGKDNTVVGYVKVSTLRKMQGNKRTPEHLAELGYWKPSEVTDPLVVVFDPKTKQMYLGEGNHRLELADMAGEQYVPVRVSRSSVPSASGEVAEVTKDSPWKGNLGEEQWPSDLHPAYVFDDADVLDNMDVIDAGRIMRESSAADAETAAIRDSIDELQAEYDRLISAKEAFDERDVPERLTILSDAMEELEGRLSLAQASLRETEGRSRKIGADLGTKNYAGAGEGDMVLVIGGERYVVPRSFDNRDYNYGSGYRAEASAQNTNRLTLDPSYRADFETGRWKRAQGPEAIDANHPAYWDTLAHVGNRMMRGDRLVQKILDGWSRESLAAWLRSPEGLAYQKTMGGDYLRSIENYDPIAVRTPNVDMPSPKGGPEITDIKGEAKPAGKVMPKFPEISDVRRGRGSSGVLSESTTGLDRIIALVNQYFPDPAVRKQLAEGELSAGDLQAALGGRTDLARIAGSDFEFVPRIRDRVSGALNRALDKVWQWIATMPEDRIARWPFYDYEFKRQLALRGEILRGAGMDKLTDAQWNALRQGAHRATLSELEKTFYNIRRYSTPVYNSRFLMTFPGAMFNSIYRWSRFTTREPERVLQLGVFGADIMRNLAVDENGDPVENIGDAKYLVLPFTKGSEAHEPGKKVRVSSFETLFPDLPSASIGVMSMATIAQRMNTNFSSFLEKAIGERAMTTMFPYGVSDNPVSNFAGGWQRDAWRWANQYLGVNDEDRNRAMIQIYDYRMYEWMQSESPDPEEMPTIEEAADEAAAMFGVQALEKLIAAFSVKHDAPGAWFAEEWSRVYEKNNFDKDAATMEYIKLYGDEAIYFTMGDNKRTTYLPPTLEAYNRIFVENVELAKRLVNIDPDNPEYVGLLAYGTDGEYAPEVSDAMRRTPLPGDDTPILSTMTEADYEAYTMRQIGWDAYTTGRVRYDADSLRLRNLRDNATNEFDRQQYRNKLAELDADWASWTAELKANNDPFRKSIAGGGKDTADSADQYLRTIISDPDFAAAHKDDVAWQKVSLFLDSREQALEEYKGLSDKEKKQYKRDFTDWVVSNLVADDEQFADLWARYFAEEWQTTEMKVEEDAA